MLRPSVREVRRVEGSGRGRASGWVKVVVSGEVEGRGEGGDDVRVACD